MTEQILDLFLVMPQRAMVFAGPRRQAVHWGAFTWEAGWQEERLSPRDDQPESTMLKQPHRWEEQKCKQNRCLHPCLWPQAPQAPPSPTRSGLDVSAATQVPMQRAAEVGEMGISLQRSWGLVFSECIPWNSWRFSKARGNPSPEPLWGRDLTGGTDFILHGDAS